MQANREICSAVPNINVQKLPKDNSSSNFTAFKSVTAMASRFLAEDYLTVKLMGPPIKEKTC